MARNVVTRFLVNSCFEFLVTIQALFIRDLFTQCMTKGTVRNSFEMRMNLGKVAR